MKRQLIIITAYFIIICTIVQSKSVLYKTTKEHYKKSEQPTLMHHDEQQNVTQLSLTSQLLSATSIAFLKQSIPRQILNCMTQFNILRCMKIYVLQKIETSTMTDDGETATNNTMESSAIDFYNRIVSNTNNEDQAADDFYFKLTDKELNKRMYLAFKHFFSNREIKLQLSPGFIVKVVASENDLLDMSLKKELVYYQPSSSDGVLSGRKKKNKYFQYMMKMGVPAFLLPIALLGSFLPMILPGLKMATLFAGTVNNAALVAALMYLARTASLENEKKNTVYYTSGSKY